MTSHPLKHTQPPPHLPRSGATDVLSGHPVAWQQGALATSHGRVVTTTSTVDTQGAVSDQGEGLVRGAFKDTAPCTGGMWKLVE